MDKKKAGHYLALIGCYCVYKMWFLMGLVLISYIVNFSEDYLFMLIISSFLFITSLIMVAYLMLKQAETHIKILKGK